MDPGRQRTAPTTITAGTAGVNDEDAIVMSITGCARCHGPGHDGLEFKKLDYPIKALVAGRIVTASHWCPCPTNAQPILFARLSSPGVT